MLPLAGNFNQDRRFARTGWLCRCGVEREEELHITDSCPPFKDIREQFSNLEDINQLVQFFEQILNRWTRTSREGTDRGKKGQE